MVFSNNASGNDEGQPRSTMRARMQSRIQTALMPRRHIQSSSMIIPSTPQSECSTLVDFAIEDILAKEEDEDEAITDEYMLESDNSAWSNGRYTPAKVPANRVRACVQQLGCPVAQDELLSSENAAWVTARPSARQAKPKTRSWFAAGRNNQAMSMTGCEPEMLDREDRAWM